MNVQVEYRIQTLNGFGAWEDHTVELASLDDVRECIDEVKYQCTDVRVIKITTTEEEIEI